MAKANAPVDTRDRELVVTRTLNAPRELVFKAWTDPAHLIKWWGPDGFINTFHEIGVKTGGTWRFMMHGPDGTDYPNRIVYEEVTAPERLTYWHDSDVDDDPNRFHVTVTFEARGNKTELTMRMVLASAEALAEAKKFGAVEGGMQTINHLEAELANMMSATGKELVIERTFSAPRAMVFKAFSEAEHLAKWWGPKGTTVTVSKLEFRPGGIFHYRMASPDGTSMWGRFVYRDIAAPERISFTSSFSDEAGNITPDPFGIGFPLQVMNTWTLSENDGKTTLTLRAMPANATAGEHRSFEALFPSMNEGYGGTLDQLEAHLATMGR